MHVIDRFITARDSTLLFRQDAIDALINNAPTPSQIYVSWAPTGLAARSILRDLNHEKIYAVNGKVIYIFREVQCGEHTGWLCYWSASGSAPVVL
jgi:hypothetical protein